MSHYPGAKKKLRLMNRLFQNVSNGKKREGGKFLNFGGKCPVGWV
jgi:hypothetical protein